VAGPEALPAVVGHEALLAEALSAIAAGRAHHALCLAGPDGVGRSLIGRHLAMAFLCPHRTAAGACGTCRSCRRFLKGSHPDVHQVAASGSATLGVLAVADLRSLGEKLWRAPGEGVGRVAVLPEAQLLQDVGQNTLLKTLEEPPPSTLFLLMVTATAALLPTVLSRCQLLRVSPLAAAQVREVLSRHGSWEPLSLEEAVAFAEGSPGAALDFLEGGGRGLMELARDLLAQDPQTLDPFPWVEALLEGKGAEGPSSGATPAQARRRRILLFLQALERQAASALRRSLLEGGGEGAYDPARPGGWEDAIEACAAAKRRILENLDPALVLEVFLLDLSRRRSPRS